MPAGVVTLIVGALGAAGTVGAAWIAGSFRSKTTESESSLTVVREELRLSRQRERILKRQLVSCIKQTGDVEDVIRMVEAGQNIPQKLQDDE